MVKFPYREICIRLNFLRRNFPTAKFPYGDISLLRNFLTAKFPKVKFPTAKFPKVKFPTAKFPTAKFPSATRARVYIYNYKCVNRFHYKVSRVYSII